MVDHVMSRRSLLKGGGAALAGLSTMQVAGPAHAFPGGRDEVLERGVAYLTNGSR